MLREAEKHRDDFERIIGRKRQSMQPATTIDEKKVSCTLHTHTSTDNANQSEKKVYIQW